MGRGRAHLAEAFRWSAGREGETAKAAAAGLGMAVPVLLAAWTGHLSFGLVVSAGGLMLSDAEVGRSLGDQTRGLAAALVLATIAAATAAMIAGRGWRTDAALVLLAGAAALVGGYSRPLAEATTRFVVFLVVVLGVTEAARDRLSFLVSMVVGALWMATASLLFGSFARAGRRLGPTAEAAAAPATAARKLARWRRSLRHLSGWQFTLRLAFCLGTAGLLRVRWPDHHLVWATLTVAVLLRRQLETFPVRTTQRAIGTTLGVIAAGLLTAQGVPAWGVVAGVGLLGAARPWLRTRNYLAYSACMTPLLILIMDAGRPVASGVLVDRLGATLVGAGLVIAANLTLAGIVARTA